MNNIIFEPREQGKQAKYRLEGLTWVSNNTAVIPRDSAGNIRMEADSEENPLVVIDPVTENILTRSALKVIDTQFQYYKFPVQVRASGSLNLDVDLSLINDPVYARYKPSENWTIAANPGDLYAGILMDKIVEGLPQTETNGYYITKEIKESGVDLRLRAKISHYFLGSQDFGTAFFTLMRSGPNKPVDRNWRPGTFAYASTPIGLYDAQIASTANSFLKQFKAYAQTAKELINLISPSPSKTALLKHFDALLANIPGDIDSVTVAGYRIPDKLRAFYASTLTYGNNIILSSLRDEYVAIGQTLVDYNSAVSQAAQVTPEDAYGRILPGSTQIVYIDEIIPNSEFDAGDIFAIGANSGQPEQHTIWEGQTYMVVTNAAKTVDEWNNPV